MKLFRRQIIVPALLLLILAILLMNVNAIGRLMYPIKYEHDIMISAQHFQIDPLLIAAIIRTESNYKPHLISSKQAVGLMQIMPTTAQWIVQSGRYEEDTLKHLAEPAVNIELGSWYVKWLIDRFTEGEAGEEAGAGAAHSEDIIAIVAASYNAGHNKVGEWLNNHVWDGRYETRGDIPYGETRHYIKRVMYYYNKYKSFY